MMLSGCLALLCQGNEHNGIGRPFGPIMLKKSMQRHRVVVRHHCAPKTNVEMSTEHRTTWVQEINAMALGGHPMPLRPFIDAMT